MLEATFGTENTTATRSNLASVVARAGDDVRACFAAIHVVDPRLAERAAALPVLTGDAVRPRFDTGEDESGQPAFAGGPGWVWFRGTPDLRGFVEALSSAIPEAFDSIGLAVAGLLAYRERRAN